MNVTGILMNQAKSMISTENSPSVETEVGSETRTSIFQQLLANEQIAGELIQTNGLDHINFINIESLRDSLDGMPHRDIEDLYALMTSDSELLDNMTRDELIDHLVPLLHTLFTSEEESLVPFQSQLKTEIQGGQSNNTSLATYFIHPAIENSQTIVQADREEVQKQYNEIMAQVEPLLAKVSNKHDLTKISTRLLALLEEWVSLTQKHGTALSNETISSSTILDEFRSESKELNIWKALVNVFQKRNELANNQLYQANAVVTTKDISKWLQNNLNTQFLIDDQVNINQINVSNKPMSKIEQYIIYVNQNETIQSVDKQLIDQFQQIMRTSRFLSVNNGVNQLSIALRPDNLGEMMIRFTEINGEMTLKIIVSSQATKHMLESNIHQLKNMFSPHQIVIEEREVIGENVQSRNEEQPFEEQEEHAHESNQEESESFKEDSELSFHEILMNEKV